MKFLNKWLRKIHRWLSIPFVLFVILTNVLRGQPVGNIFQMVQQISMIILIISGLYLYLLPYLTKRNRNARRKSA